MPGFFSIRPREQAAFMAIMAIACLFLAARFCVLAANSDGLSEFQALPTSSVQLRIDLNRARWPELSALPGIGPGMAKAIVSHRRKNGPFRNVEDIVHVNGIGPSTLAAIRSHVVVQTDWSTMNHN